MLTTKNFTREEAMAIMSVVGGASPADMDVDRRELNFINNLKDLFDITETEKARFMSMRMDEAGNIISRMSYDKKRLVSSLLTTMVFADGRVHPLEERYLQFVASKCGLSIETDPTLALRMAEDFFSASR